MVAEITGDQLTGRELLLGRRGAAKKPRTIGFNFKPAQHDIGVGEILTDSSQSHVLLLAPTGAGKGVNFIMPNLLSDYHGQIWIIDVKGESWHVTARHRRTLGPVITLDPFGVVTKTSDSFNVLDWLIASPEQLADNALMLAHTIAGDVRDPQNAFWDDNGDALVAALIVLMATSKEKAKRTLGEVYKVLSLQDPDYHIESILDGQKIHEFARTELGNYLKHEAEKVRTSVRSTAQQRLRLLSSSGVQRAVGRTSFNLELIRSGTPLTGYIILPPAKISSHSGLLRLWLSTILGIISERTSAPETGTLLIVDELPALGSIPLLLTAISLLRGYGLRTVLVAQSMAQLIALWPHAYQMVVENCGLLLTYGHYRQTQSQKIAEVLGDIGAEQLFNMRPDQLAISRARQGTSIEMRLDYRTDELFKGRYDPNPFITPPPTKSRAKSAAP